MCFNCDDKNVDNSLLTVWFCCQYIVSMQICFVSLGWWLKGIWMVGGFLNGGLYLVRDGDCWQTSKNRDHKQQINTCTQWRVYWKSQKLTDKVEK